MRAVVIDWDGTLADSHGSLFAANAAVMRAFDLPFDEARYRLHYAPDWRVMYRRLGVPPEHLEEANRIWARAFDGVARTQLLPGAKLAVERLAAAGIPLALVTAGPSAVVAPQLERLCLADLLRTRVFGDDLPAQKPDPAPLLRALRLLGVQPDPSDVAYVGDAPDDMRMAVAAGVHGVGVVSGLSDRQSLIAAGASQVVDRIAEWVDRVVAREPAIRRRN